MRGFTDVNLALLGPQHFVFQSVRLCVCVSEALGCSLGLFTTTVRCPLESEIAGKRKQIGSERLCETGFIIRLVK